MLLLMVQGLPFKWSEVTQSCPTLCDPMDCSLPVSSIPGILQAGILEWVAISFSRRFSQPRDRTWVSRIAGRRFTIWTRDFPSGSGGKASYPWAGKIPWRKWKWSRSVVSDSCPTSRVLPVVSYQAPPSLGFSRQEYWSGLTFPSPGDLPNPGIKPGSPVLQADALPSEPLLRESLNKEYGRSKTKQNKTKQNFE